MINVDIFVILRDQMAVGPGGTESSVKSKLSSSTRTIFNIQYNLLSLWNFYHFEGIARICAALFYGSLTQARVILEEETSIENMALLYWHVNKPVIQVIDPRSLKRQV